ncbi:hypothetical protein EXIGLDRAFT_829628 [Exidia glandulosa HHB12029]|uniref:Transcriptional regulatory protein RXT2 N-terminal domain-containing protein n=1 Tax=Exidia glandulosa HHB12029 TaxID=1314781 RepID=A0A165PEU2_EXIGL|nr:hypothetical protein EXIGLDRAFT_829628 [Exidia glandulosa HHB12029]
MSRKRRASPALQNGHVRDEQLEWRIKDEVDDLEPVASTSTSNWGAKSSSGAQWSRRGKIAAWGPGRDEYELQERARKRIRGLLPHSRSPSPPIPTLPHLRAPSPPHVAPYVPPSTQHSNFMSYVLDESVQHAFRSRLLPDLQRSACNLIEGESDLKRALGRFMSVLADPPKHVTPALNGHTNPPVGLLTNGFHHDHDEDGGAVAKKEDDEEDVAAALRDEEMFPQIDKLFVTNGDVTIMGHTLSARDQSEHLLKALGALRDMQDDGREYIERLAELREGLGEICYQRHSIWNLVRERALKEMGAEGDR